MTEFKYLVDETWYSHKEHANVQLREIVVEYGDGDLHHLFTIKGFNSAIPKEVKPDNVMLCRTKVMEYIYRYHNAHYDDIVGKTSTSQFESIGTLLSSKKKRNLLSRFANHKQTDEERLIAEMRLQGQFSSNCPDPLNDLPGFRKRIKELLKEEQDCYKNVYCDCEEESE